MNKLAYCCWSGGKDSSMSLYKAKKDDINIRYLFNMAATDGNHSRSHGISSDLLKRQAESIGTELVRGYAEWGTYENEFKKVVKSMKSKGINSGIYGDIDLMPHREWVERVAAECGIEPFLPLWKMERDVLINEFISLGFKAVVCATNSDFMNESWLGRDIDKSFVDDIVKQGNIDLCGEKGEYHTFVYDGPIFKKPVSFVQGKKILKNEHWFLEILKND